ncbi:hypothetical protein IW262DRAFT_1302223 [Armillaria fumosa]|nr:hypothetical protein IW262DRAFT_1302223 [Armillaria fumosa]
MLIVLCLLGLLASCEVLLAYHSSLSSIPPFQRNQYPQLDAEILDQATSYFQNFLQTVLDVVRTRLVLSGERDRVCDSIPSGKLRNILFEEIIHIMICGVEVFASFTWSTMICRI